MKRISIIPAINSKTFKEIKKNISLVFPYSNWIHLDVADGVFTPNKTWNNPKDLLKLKNLPKIEVHLMIDSIDENIKDWLIPPVKRIIFHLEAAKSPFAIISKIKKSKKDVGISISPQTSASSLAPYFKKVKFFQPLGVNPGQAGQKFQRKVLAKVRYIRKNCPACTIEGDGGMKVGVIRQMVEAGADKIAAASAIFGQPNIKKAIETLRKDAKKIKEKSL